MIKITMVRYEDSQGIHRARVYEERLLAKQIKVLLKKYRMSATDIVPTATLGWLNETFKIF